MSIDPAVIIILTIFIVLVILFRLIEKLVYRNDIRTLYGAFRRHSGAEASNPYNAVVRVFTQEGQLLFNRVTNNNPGQTKGDQGAFSYQVCLTDDSVVFIPKKVLTSRHLVLPFDKITAIQYGTQDLGKLQPLETISAIIKIPALTNNVQELDYYTFLHAYLSKSISKSQLSEQLKDTAKQNKMVYVCIQTPQYSFLINYRYKFGVRSR
jgi:hypothetical protein